ncbi:MAG: hypothetical protein IPI07_08930 [Flavobacteriales bacterium]|nr:hypothetical protein [Flavobacteriales bacterium]
MTINVGVIAKVFGKFILQRDHSIVVAHRVSSELEDHLVVHTYEGN